MKVAPLGKGEPVQAITYQGVNVERYHIPPTQHYMDLVIQGAYSFGLSMMWIAYLQSFSTQAGRKPRPPQPGTGDAASRLSAGIKPRRRVTIDFGGMTHNYASFIEPSAGAKNTRSTSSSVTSTNRWGTRFSTNRIVPGPNLLPAAFHFKSRRGRRR